MAVEMYGNINGTYEPPKIDLFSLAKEHNNPDVMPIDTESDNDISPIKFDISAEGMRALFVSKFPDWIDLKTEIANKKFEFEHQPVTSFKDRIYIDMNSILDVKNAVGGITLSDKREALLDSFKAIADEIYTGYADGSRLRYVKDDDSKDGFRQLSQEEELSILQQDLDEFVDERFGEEHQKRNLELSQILKTFGNMMGNSWQKYYEPEKIPEDFKDSIIDSSKKYIEGLK